MAEDREKQTITSADVGSLDSVLKAPTSTRDKFAAELAVLNEKSAPLREQRDKLADSIRPTEDKIRDLNLKIKEIEQPRKGELERLVAALS